MQGQSALCLIVIALIRESEWIMIKRSYPTPEERTAIIARREQILDALMAVFATSGQNEAQADAEMHALMRQHGEAEVGRLFVFLADRLDEVAQGTPNPDQFYIDYVRLYRRFGQQRQFLDAATFAHLSDERAELKIAQYETNQPATPAVQQRIEALNDLLLLNAILWEDLVPEAPPPPEHPVWQITLPPEPTLTGQGMLPTAPGTRSHKKIGRNAPCWCGSGRKYKHCHLREDEQRGI
jgi:hypothetical protein